MSLKEMKYRLALHDPYVTYDDDILYCPQFCYELSAIFLQYCDKDTTDKEILFLLFQCCKCRRLVSLY